MNQRSSLFAAGAYDTLHHEPDHAYVMVSYSVFARVVLRQWEQLKEGGMSFVASIDDPYRDSAEMLKDVDQGRLRVYADNGITLPEDHPMRAEVDAGVEGFVVLNDIFRGVHDVMGHAVAGSGFGPKGEDLAWQAHRRTMPRVAHNALWCETKGQNSWTNFAHGHDLLPLPDRPYGEQKAVLAPPVLV